MTPVPFNLPAAANRNPQLFLAALERETLANIGKECRLASGRLDEYEQCESRNCAYGGYKWSVITKKRGLTPFLPPARSESRD